MSTDIIPSFINQFTKLNKKTMSISLYKMSIQAIALSIIVLLVSLEVSAYTETDAGKIVGPTHVSQYQSYEYTFDVELAGTVNSIVWSTVGGSTQYYSPISAYVSWSTTGSVTLIASVEITNNGSTTSSEFTFDLTVYAVPVTPSKPTLGTVSCGSTEVKRGSNTGATFYWQKDNEMQTTSRGSAATLDATENGWYYLRAKNDYGWSQYRSEGVYVTIIESDVTGAVQGNHDAFDRYQGTLQATGYEGDVFTWHEDVNGSWNVVGSAVATLDIDVTKTTQYRLKVDSELCPDSYDYKTVYVHTRPEIEQTAQVDGKRTLELTANYSSYEWFLDGNLIAGETDETYDAVESGNYKVKIVTTSGNLTATSDEVALAINITNILPEDPHYALSTGMLVAGIKSVDSIDDDNSTVSTSYYDEFGRSIQTIVKRASPTGKDVVSFNEFDFYGKSSKNYLPYVATTVNGSFHRFAKSEQASFYTSGSDLVDQDQAPWTEAKTDKTHMSRVVSAGGMGEGYQLSDDHATQYEYKFNALEDKVFKWKITTSGKLELHDDIFFDANDLSKQIVKSPEYTSGDNHKSITFTNYLGQKILIRYYSDSQQFDTYYVYDKYGRLVYVVPPEASKLARDTGVDRVDDEVLNFNQTLPSSSSNSGSYYYDADVTITLSEDEDVNSNPIPRVFTDGFSLKALPVGPEASGTTTQTDFGKLLFVNEYDEYHRLISKIVPGADPVYFVYDKAGKLRLSQDGVQRIDDKWTFTKYDQLDRPVLTGIYTDEDRNHAELQNYVMAKDPTVHESRGTNRHGYDNVSWPTNVSESGYLVVSYYDDYDFMDTDWAEFAFDPNNGINEDAYRVYSRGLETGGKIKVLGANQWLKSVKYYDDDFQLLQGVSDHHRGGLEKVYTVYNTWLGEVTNTRFRHEMSDGKIIIIDERFVYDEGGRLLEQFHSIDGEPEILIAAYQYNELGELIEKNLHKQADDTFVQSVDYRYNIRGQLTNINRSNRNTLSAEDTDDTPDRFGMQLFYDSSPYGLTFNEQKNGSLVGTTWGQPNMNGSDQRSYAYDYDPVSRLSAATFNEKDNGSWGVNANHYNVSDITYDLNGNIKTLKRNHENVEIDDLDYQYDGNQLLSLDDQTNDDEGFKDGAELAIEYTYDANGNTLSDANKLIQSISYNMLNKPEVITFTNGDHIDYVYDASGTRLSMTVHTGGDTYVTDYTSGMIFEDDELTIISMPQGRIVVEKVAADYNYDYQYYLTDHLGNTRAIVAPTERIYKATMETENATTEEAQFLNIAATRQLDAANAKWGDESARLNAKDDKIIGPAKAIKVYSGDVVAMQVHAKYTDIVGNSSVGSSTIIADALTSAFGISSGELFSSLADNFAGSSLLAPAGEDAPPNAYINYILYDENYENPQIGTEQIKSESNNEYALLEANDLLVPDDGYLLIWLSNETDRDVDVFFDHFKITHTSSANVMQSDDYYPFGLPITSNNYQDVGNKENRFLYQGKEWQTALALNLYDFHARQYDPATGRFLGNDPKADLYSTMSPFAGMANNPMMSIDPNGEEVITAGAVLLAAAIGAAMGGAAYTASVAFSDGGFDNWDWGQFGKGVGIGAITGAVTYGVGNALSESPSLLLDALVKGASDVGIEALLAGEKVDGLAILAASGAHLLTERMKFGKENEYFLKSIKIDARKDRIGIGFQVNHEHSEGKYKKFPINFKYTMSKGKKSLKHKFQAGYGDDSKIAGSYNIGRKKSWSASFTVKDNYTLADKNRTLITGFSFHSKNGFGFLYKPGFRSELHEVVDKGNFDVVSYENWGISYHPGLTGSDRFKFAGGKFSGSFDNAKDRMGNFDYWFDIIHSNLTGKKIDSVEVSFYKWL